MLDLTHLGNHLLNVTVTLCYILLKYKETSGFGVKLW